MKSKPPKKLRLDSCLVEKGLVKSRHRARALIMAGKVIVDDMKRDKPGFCVNESAKIILNTDDNPFVSRGGLKLDNALKTISISVKDCVCLDIGASTGGFTDCLLQNGAKKIFSVDVGYGQLDWSLRNSPKVEVIERTNIRHMPYEKINQKVDIVVADTSFISLKIVIPSAEKFMRQGTAVLALIKPQFEAGKENISKGGVVRDEKVRKDVVEDITGFFKNRGYRVNEIIPSPVLGPKGNQEYIIFMGYQKK